MPVGVVASDGEKDVLSIELAHARQEAVQIQKGITDEHPCTSPKTDKGDTSGLSNCLQSNAWQEIENPDVALQMTTAVDEEQENEDNDSTVDLQEWQTGLMELFDEIDTDGSGTIDATELAAAFGEVGIPSIEAFQVFSSLDDDESLEIDRLEWLHAIQEGARDDTDQFVQFAKKLLEMHTKRGSIFQGNKKSQRCIIRHDSPPRMFWDLLLVGVLFYLSISLPFAMGFGQIEALARLDLVLDILFFVRCGHEFLHDLCELK
jgi:hypothetical protein